MVLIAGLLGCRYRVLTMAQMSYTCLCLSRKGTQQWSGEARPRHSDEGLKSGKITSDLESKVAWNKRPL